VIRLMVIIREMVIKDICLIDFLLFAFMVSPLSG
jgi:hypothetical protein